MSTHMFPVCIRRDATCLPCSKSSSFPTTNCSTNMAAPPKDTIYAYWQATLLVTKGHTVKILNLWRTQTLITPKYAEKAQKRCCVLCVWLYLLSSSFEQWPKGHYFIGLRCWLPHNVQKSCYSTPVLKLAFACSIIHMTQASTHTLTHKQTVHRKMSVFGEGVISCTICSGYSERSSLLILSKVMTDWQRSCYIHLCLKLLKFSWISVIMKLYT